MIHLKYTTYVGKFGVHNPVCAFDFITVMFLPCHNLLVVVVYFSNVEHRTPLTSNYKIIKLPLPWYFHSTLS